MSTPLQLDRAASPCHRARLAPRVVAALLLAAACGGPDREARPAGDRPPDAPAVTPAGEGEAERPSALAFRVPSDDDIPDGALGRSIRRGRALLNATRDSLPGHVGNRLRCTSCHLDDGVRAGAMPWVGVYARFPQYRSRNDLTNVLEDRVNDCFQRSMAGRPLEFDSPEMRDIVAYMAFLSRGYPVGHDRIEGQGLPPVEPLATDTARGRAVYASVCAACHGADGEGTAAATPLWGPQSYTIGAGMARLRTAAAFVRHNMPYGNPTLTDQQAFDVAAYVNSRPRPDFAGKERDWPRGDPPPDVAYETDAGRRPAGAPPRP